MNYLGYDVREIISKWDELFFRTAKYEGRLQAVKKAKEWYTLCLRKAGGLSFDPLPFTSASKDGFPKRLNFVKPWIEDDSIHRRRAALTVLQLYKLQSVEGVYSLKSITAPSTGIIPQAFSDQYDIVSKRLFPESSINERIESLRPAFHISGRNGPNGPMLGTAFVDREAIRGTTLEKSINRLCQLTGNYQLMGVLSQSRAAREVQHNKGREKSHGRVRIKYESGGKTRPFAIVDFFSQTALKPLHEFLMDWLKKQPQDGSDSHSKVANDVREWTKSSQDCWSFDLTAATDRWPVELIHRSMTHCFGEEIADCWKSIITDRTFIGPKGEEVRWAVGQPLGALSSWASFAVSHHTFIQTCERIDWLNSKLTTPRRKLPWRKPTQYYRMIGDDVVLTQYPGIARTYKDMLGTIGVEISLSKSVLPEHCLKGNVAEMAKRLFTNGQELTPVPPESIVRYSVPFGTRSLLEQALMRDYLDAGSPYSVQSTLGSLQEWRLLTFPFRNALPQLNGVKKLFPIWEQTGNPPAGLSPEWFYWLTKPEEDLRSLVQEFILSEVSKAEMEANQLVHSLSFTVGPVNPLEKSLPQGGDWQPGPTRCHPQIILTVLREVSQKLMEMSFTWMDPNLLEEDLYKMIGQFHVFLEPKLIVFGRKAVDEKELTRLQMSKIVKYCYNNIDNYRQRKYDSNPGL